MTKERWFYIKLSYATFGISSINDIINNTAPIAQWMKGKKLIEIKPWLISKKAKVIEI